MSSKFAFELISNPVIPSQDKVVQTVLYNHRTDPRNTRPPLFNTFHMIIPLSAKKNFSIEKRVVFVLNNRITVSVDVVQPPPFPKCIG